ncbi:hypothetical protein B0H14DRAFT_1049215 [Mycena olivaceomarginata]|nr:hypothetical protein B0H14DRAFT_1049215 [Mycena olivaceomarginata]
MAQPRPPARLSYVPDTLILHAAPLGAHPIFPAAQISSTPHPTVPTESAREFRLPMLPCRPPAPPRVCPTRLFGTSLSDSQRLTLPACPPRYASKAAFPIPLSILLNGFSIFVLVLGLLRNGLGLCSCLDSVLSALGSNHLRSHGSQSKTKIKTKRQNENGADRNTAPQDVADAAVDTDTRTRTREELESNHTSVSESTATACVQVRLRFLFCLLLSFGFPFILLPSCRILVFFRLLGLPRVRSQARCCCGVDFGGRSGFGFESRDRLCRSRTT